MKLLIASDIHGSAYWCGRLMKKIEEEAPSSSLETQTYGSVTGWFDLEEQKEEMIEDSMEFTTKKTDTE